MRDPIEPNFSTSALITIDTQNDFTLDSGTATIPGTREIIPGMVRLLKIYRSLGLPVVHVVRLYYKDGSNAELCRKKVVGQDNGIAAPGTQGAELVKDLKPDPSVKLDSSTLLSGKFQIIGKNEYVMYKPRWGAFYGTQLEEFLKEHRIDTVVFSGCNFPNCPRTSIYEASERDFRIVLVKDAVSQLYPRGEQEMQNIGVWTAHAGEIEACLARPQNFSCFSLNAKGSS